MLSEEDIKILNSQGLERLVRGDVSMDKEIKRQYLQWVWKFYPKEAAEKALPRSI